MNSSVASEHEGGDDDANAEAWDANFPTDEETPEEPGERETTSAAPPPAPTPVVTPSPSWSERVPLETPAPSAIPHATPAAATTPEPSRPAPAGDERPMTLAEVFLAGQEKPKFPTRIVSAAAVFAGIFGAAALVGHAISNLALPDVKLPSLESLLAKPEVSKRDEWLKDALEGKLEEQQWDLLPMVGKHAPAGPAAKVPSAMAGRGRAKVHHAAKSAPAVTAPPPVAADDDDTDPVFAEIFGSAGRYEEGSKHPSARPGAAAPGGHGGTDVRGTVLGARLQDEVSSDTMGAPVIAVLSKQAKVGKHVWPAGTEIHGEVAGNSDTRIFVNFVFARLADKSTVRLDGRARDSGGRSGIPGKKLFNKQSAGSIGLSAGTKMMQQLGRELAGPAGSILGSGIAGAGDSASEKAQRADRDEYVVLVASGTTFSVYLESIGGDDAS